MYKMFINNNPYEGKEYWGQTINTVIKYLNVEIMRVGTGDTYFGNRKGLSSDNKFQ